MLEERNRNQRLINALRNLYGESRSQIKLGNEHSKESGVTKGLRYGCYTSLTLFKIYIEKALQTWKRKYKGMGVDFGDFGGMCLYTRQFSNNQVVIANCKKDLQYMALILREEYKKMGLQIRKQIKNKILPYWR